MADRKTTTHGFARTSKLLSPQVRRASETRGFAQSRVLTHWPEIAGEDIATITRPVQVTYSRNGFGATLVVLTTGANAPMVEMQKDMIRERVNAVYGYNAIARVRVTQTATSGFSDGQVSFAHRSDTPAAPVVDPAVQARVTATVTDVTDQGLRVALERLATNVISRPKSRR